ncbi:MAG: hypothetical protein QOG52_403 [Frankiaceae bacterium]|nr:hypothetical protein [Frankiaceae bacterium]
MADFGRHVHRAAEQGRRALRGRLTALACAVSASLVLTACTGSHPSSPTAPPSATASGVTPPTSAASSTTSAPTGDATTLPVAGSVIYRMGKHGDVVVRIAAHALRRVASGTVLDWSITPLQAPDDNAVRFIVGSEFDVTADGQQPVDLYDPVGGTIYRPLLSNYDEGAGVFCLCRGFYGAGLELHKTAIFQAVFPPLPGDATTEDMTINGFVIPGVPVTPLGQSPAGGNPVDLTAPPSPSEPGSLSATGPHTRAFSYPQGIFVDAQTRKQQRTIAVDGLYSYPGGSLLVWTVTAATPGEIATQIAAGTPLSEYSLHPFVTGYKDTVADGAGLLPSGADPATRATLRSDYATLTARHQAPPNGPPHWRICMCSDWQTRAVAWNNVGDSVTMATNFAALPAGTRTATVSFPGSTVAPLRDIPVTPLTPNATGSPQPVETKTWHLRLGLGGESHPLAPSDWPTPVPDEASYAGFPIRVVDHVIHNTSTPTTRSDTQGRKTEFALDSTVLFALNSAKLLPRASAELARIAAEIDSKAAAGSTVAVDGYVSDHDGQSVAAGQQLSAARAAAVYAALKPLVTVSIHWSAAGHGAEDPVAPNDNEADRQLNRRVTISYQH